jgi:hypothetical protein
MVNLFERRIFDYLQAGSSFRWASRTEFADLTYEKYEKIVLDEGLPFVVSHVTEDWHNDPSFFTPQWLKEHFGNITLFRFPRDVKKCEDLQGWTLSQYIEYIYRYRLFLDFGAFLLKDQTFFCLGFLSSLFSKNSKRSFFYLSLLFVSKTFPFYCQPFVLLVIKIFLKLSILLLFE